MNENSTDRRDRLMAALSVAEQITATSTALPYDITVRPGGVDIMVLRTPGDVPLFAAQFGLKLSLREQLAGNGRPLLEAHGSIGEVPVRLWALGDTADWDRFSEVAAAALLSSGLPAEWSAAVSS